MGTVTFKGIEYDIWICGMDIHLQSTDNDVIIKNGYTEVESNAILDKAVYVKGYRGRELDYNPIEVQSRIADTIEKYCYNYLNTH